MLARTAAHIARQLGCKQIVLAASDAALPFWRCPHLVCVLVFLVCRPAAFS